MTGVDLTDIFGTDVHDHLETACARGPVKMGRGMWMRPAECALIVYPAFAKLPDWHVLRDLNVRHVARFRRTHHWFQAMLDPVPFQDGKGGRVQYSGRIRVAFVRQLYGCAWMEPRGSGTRSPIRQRPYAVQESGYLRVGARYVGDSCDIRATIVCLAQSLPAQPAQIRIIPGNP